MMGVRSQGWSAAPRLILTVAVLLVAGACTLAPGPEAITTDATAPTVTTTSVPPPPTTTPAPTTTRVTIADSDVTFIPFVPEVSVEDGMVSLLVEFTDGSRARLQWPEELDLISEGVIPYGSGWVESEAGSFARDFIIRSGDIEEVLGGFGGAELLDEYEDAQGGMVGFWRPRGWFTDFLAFQFGSWVVLVYDYRFEARMDDNSRQLWATNFYGEETEDGYLLLSADPPAELASAGEYPSPLQLTLSSDQGEILLIPRECDPASEIYDGAHRIGDTETHFASWCDTTGLVTVHIYGTPEFADTVYDQLHVSDVHVVGATD